MHVCHWVPVIERPELEADHLLVPSGKGANSRTCTFAHPARRLAVPRNDSVTVCRHVKSAGIVT